MADAQLPGMSRAAAIALVDTWLAGKVRAASLDADALARWARKGITHGWRFSVESSNGPLTLDLLIDARFPRTRPRVAWVNAPPFPSLPHVEDDGLLCILSQVDELDRHLPIGIVKKVLGGAADILENGFTGANREDFRTEFLSYWNPIASGRDLLSLLDPSGPSRRTSVWRGKTVILAAENPNEIRRWLANAYGKRAVAGASIEPGFLIWLDRPLLPEQYPETPADLRRVAALADDEAASLVDQLLSHDSERTTLLLGADAGNGACFAGVEITRRKPGGRPHTPRVTGFRPERAPGVLVSAARLHDRLTRGSVERGDAWWVHGRDGNADLIELLGVTVGMIGCGSLGAPVARLLAQAGVGRLRLIDADFMSWPNVGRHALGASAVHQRKALALADRLAREFPHLQFDSIAKPWQLAVHDEPAALTDCQLLVSTIGSWGEESELNEWLLHQHSALPILFGWSEPHGCAGQAVIIRRGSGCFACGLTDHGEALFKVVEFPGETLQREAACGAYFQPYGASQMMLIATVVADLAVDLLCERADPGTHRMVAARSPLIDAAGGQFSQSWIDLSDGRKSGGNVEEKLWMPRHTCRVCGGRGLA
jgi:hypothetical protein